LKNRESAQASRSRQKEYIQRLEEGNKQLEERLGIVEKQNLELMEKLDLLMSTGLDSLQQPLGHEIIQPSLLENTASPKQSKQPESFLNQLFPTPIQDLPPLTQEQQTAFSDIFDFSPTNPLYPNLSFQPSLSFLNQEHKTGPTATKTLQQLSSLTYQNLAIPDLNHCGFPTISLIRCTLPMSFLVEMVGKKQICLERKCFRNEFPICAKVPDFVNKKLLS
jgi:hypothetical protein